MLAEHRVTDTEVPNQSLGMLGVTANSPTDLDQACHRATFSEASSEGEVHPRLHATRGYQSPVVVIMFQPLLDPLDDSVAVYRSQRRREVQYMVAGLAHSFSDDGS